MEKQTAVEWLYKNLKSHFEHNGDLLEVVQMSFEQAKEMEKEQIIKAAARGYLAMAERFNLEEAKDYGQQYYDNICGGKDII
jgi:hypothetical protein